MTILLMAALLVAQDVPHNELTENLASPVDHVVTTTKRPLDMELCVGGVISVLGMPAIFRNGDRQTVIASFMPGALGGSGAVMVTATMTQQDDQTTRIDIRVRGNGWDGRMRDRIATCAETAR